MDGNYRSKKCHFAHMSSRYLITVVAVICSMAIGASLAFTRSGTSRPKPSIASPLASPLPSPSVSPSQPSERPSSERPPSDSPSSKADRELPIRPDTEPPETYIRQPIRLSDRVPPRSDFNQFRDELRSAIENRDAVFVESLIPDQGVGIGFGRPVTANNLDLENPNAQFWLILEKAIVHGCDEAPREQHPETDPNSQGWVCHNITNAFYEQYPKPESEQGISYETSRVIVVGKGVNVRTQPNINSESIAKLTDEIVWFNRQTWEQTPEEERSSLDALDGWTPVILPDGQRGYVNNRYAYSPLSYRVIFGQINEKWQILQVPGGD